MTRLDVRTMVIPAADLGGDSSLPSIRDIRNVQQRTRTRLGDEDGLFVGYGFRSGVFPYRQQDRYGRDLSPKAFDTCVLENRHLRAVFVPSLGGRLWSLVDKDKGRELLFANPVFQPGNLAARNAWFSGGVEWNMGIIGHSPLTCSTLFTARLVADDGTPVLRMYEYERIRGCTYQMDFFLPEASRLLHARMRIVNPNAETVPMYWWSNIAVAEDPGGRVIMPAREAYSYRDGAITRMAIPQVEGTDVTYPVNNRHAVDFFWRIPEGERTYICHLDQNGCGLVQASTRRLRGRKLFVWGQGPGGDRWQEFLSQAGTGGRYLEIQAGLAHTQYECLPMPPRTAWEWMETYGAMEACPSRIHGTWEEACSEVGEQLDRLVEEAALERLLASTRETLALQPAGDILFRGSGWGALEAYRRQLAGEEPLSLHLDFGTLGEEQRPWAALLESGSLPATSPLQVPASWMHQAEYRERLERSVRGPDADNAAAWMHLGMMRFDGHGFDAARDAFERSLAIAPGPFALYGLSQTAMVAGDPAGAAELAVQAALLLPGEISLAREALHMLAQAGLYERILALLPDFGPPIRSDGRVRLMEATALAHQDRLEEAETILFGHGGLVVPDNREGENSVCELWFLVQEKRAEREGRAFDRDAANPPSFLDFRMLVERPRRPAPGEGDAHRKGRKRHE